MLSDRDRIDLGSRSWQNRINRDKIYTAGVGVMINKEKTTEK
jgi:hypothetical protein